MNRTCPCCFGNAAPLFEVGDLNRLRSRQKFSYFRCLTCGTVFLDPVPVDLAHYYGGDYPAYRKPSDHELAGLTLQESHKVEILKRYATSGRLLEIGSSYGAFLYAASQEGFIPEAIEMDAECCAYIRQRFGATVHQAVDVLATLSGLGTYDVITLWHVIEHLADPVSIIETAAEHLAPGGILIIAAPNPESLEFRLFRRFWVHLDAPRHIRFLPLGFVGQIAERSGLTEVFSASTGESEAPFNTFGWFRWSLQHLLTGCASFGGTKPPSCNEQPCSVLQKRKSRFSPGVVVDRVLKVVYDVLWKPVINRTGRSNSYTIVLRKAL